MAKKNKPNRSKPYDNKVTERRIARDHVSRPNPSEQPAPAAPSAATPSPRPDAAPQSAQQPGFDEFIDPDNPDAQSRNDRQNDHPTDRPNVH